MRGVKDQGTNSNLGVIERFGERKEDVCSILLNNDEMSNTSKVGEPTRVGENDQHDVMQHHRDEIFASRLNDQMEHSTIPKAPLYKEVDFK